MSKVRADTSIKMDPLCDRLLPDPCLTIKYWVKYKRNKSHIVGGKGTICQKRKIPMVPDPT